MEATTVPTEPQPRAYYRTSLESLTQQRASYLNDFGAHWLVELLIGEFFIRFVGHYENEG